MTSPPEPVSDQADPDAAEERDEAPRALVGELQSSAEELRIVHEEMRLQNEQLRATREQLHRQRERYSSLFELAPVGYVITDQEGIIVEANRLAAEQLGRDSRFLRGKPIAALIGAERRAAFRALLREAAQGARWQDEVPFLRPDGSRARFVVHAVGPAMGGDKNIRWSLAERLSADGYSVVEKRGDAGRQAEETDPRDG